MFAAGVSEDVVGELAQREGLFFPDCMQLLLESQVLPLQSSVLVENGAPQVLLFVIQHFFDPRREQLHVTGWRSGY